MQKFFLYARKSTDVEDKQVRSIEDQIAELRAFAEEEGLEIIEELIEKQSAKIPGRPIFNEMIKRIEKGEANGILAWHPDRLARNSVDGGKIIYLLDCGHLAMLKFPTFWFESTPQGKFMLNIAFGQSKYYVDNLSENTKRGLRQKVKRGEYPGFAPIGYLNDSRIKNVVVDKKKSIIIKKAFELYSENNSRLEDVSNFLAQQGITARSGKLLKRDRISFILSNPFYVGLFRYAGETHEGKHQPVISKKIFDKVQEILKQRGRPHHKQKNEPQAFCGLLKCGKCGMAITGEYKVKKQKNGNEHYYTYYHCTHKSKITKCTEPCIRQEILDKQISSLLQKFSLKKDWADELNKMLEKDKTKSAQSFTAFVQENKERIAEIQTKLQRLLDGYLEQDIEREIYRTEKAKLLSEKKSLEEKISNLEQKQTGWLEPMRNWIKTAESIGKIANNSDLFGKKVAAREIFGSNLILQNREARRSAPSETNSPLKTQWAALCAAREFVGKKEKSFIVERVMGIEPVARSSLLQNRGTLWVILNNFLHGKNSFSRPLFVGPIPIQSK
ncbi:MAG: recombinase family protein [Candidatus Staskawiczbacteria bacterium]|nr:recombinase family protein [Candidatus Staskawiczbacteria bacterium]